MDWGFHEAFLLWSKKECFLQWEPSTAGITFAEMWWNSHHWRFSRCNGAGCKIILLSSLFLLKMICLMICFGLFQDRLFSDSLILLFCGSKIVQFPFRKKNSETVGNKWTFLHTRLWRRKLPRIIFFYGWFEGQRVADLWKK